MIAEKIKELKEFGVQYTLEKFESPMPDGTKIPGSRLSWEEYHQFTGAKLPREIIESTDYLKTMKTSFEASVTALTEAIDEAEKDIVVSQGGSQKK